jgi:ParB family chromosome partitioning protein
LRQLLGAAPELTEDERTAMEALQAERDKLESEYETAEELPEEVDRRLGEIETALENFEKRPLDYDPVEVARAGAFVSIAADGALSVDRGYVRPVDEPPVTPEGEDASDCEAVTAEPDETTAVQRAVITLGGELAQPEEEEDEGIKPLPDRLLTELTAHRTLALRDAVANNPHIAMTALLHKLVSDNFLHPAGTGCLEANVRHVFFPAQTEELKDCPSAKSIDERRESWGDHIPADDEALWDWLAALDEESRMALLAHCVSYGVNALYERPNPYGASGVTEHGLKYRMRQADRVARATGLDMVEAGWRPTVGNYLGRVTKARILEAVREGAGDRAAQMLEHLKKGDMAKEAERLLADCNWLPEPLRLDHPDGEPLTESSVDADRGEAALPAFLADGGDDDEASETEDDQSRVLAAE